MEGEGVLIACAPVNWLACAPVYPVTCDEIVKCMFVSRKCANARLVTFAEFVSCISMNIHKKDRNW